MKRRLGRISLLLLATSFSLMTFSSAALADHLDDDIKALQDQQKFIKKTLLRPAEKANDDVLAEAYRQQLETIKQQIKQLKASNKV
jgi:hypothetical protein